MKPTIRKSLLVAAFALMMTGFSSFRNGSQVNVKAFAATGNSCDRCIQAAQNDRNVCNYLIQVCGVDWFIDPCEFSPGALCECATGCNSGSTTSQPGL